MNVFYLQNASHTGPGNILDWGAARGHQIKGTLLFAGEKLPAMYPELLIILGGVPAECSEWLTQEILYIREAINAGSRVLGLCLGSQLIVEALGGSLVPHVHSECGWWEVKLNEKGLAHPALAGLNNAEFFFFHRNTVMLPDNMILLGENPGCRHQIFAFGDKVIGIQGHPEMRAETIEYLVREKKDYVEKGSFVNITDKCHLEEVKLVKAQEFVWGVMDNLLKF